MTPHDNELHANTHRHTYQSLILAYITLCSRRAVDFVFPWYLPFPTTGSRDVILQFKFCMVGWPY